MSKIDLYKKNQKTAKVIGVITPICFWGLVALSVICLIFAVRNSVGNIIEITELLDTRYYNAVEIEQNYNYLIDKFGEWVIGSGSNGFTLVFVNIGNAMFGGFAVFNGVMSVLFLVSAFILGKWVLPYTKNSIEQRNQDIVNLTILDKEEKE